MGLMDLDPELRDTNTYQVMTARKVAPSSADKLMHLVPYPEGVDVKNPLPEWTRLPLSAKIPFVRAPKDYIVYKRGKLGEAVRRQGKTFDLSDPYNYGLQMKYEPIHDKHLRNYFYSPGNKKILDDMGLLTKENQVKCKLKEYNAYRGYVYNVHKNSVLKALREKEEMEQDKAEARKFIEAAGHLRDSQKTKEQKMKHALRMAAHRRVVGVCQRLLCENRLKKLKIVQEKKQKQKEHAKLRLLVSQKNFQEQLKEYKVKSQEVSFQRNIRAQNKWKRVNENEEYRKNVAAQVEEISKLKEVIENWIKKEIYQLKQWDRHTKIYNAFKKYSDKRRKARGQFFRQKQIENARKTEYIRKHGPKSRRTLQKEEIYKKMGNIYAGVRKIPPDMNVYKYENHILQDVMSKAVLDDTKLFPKKYWGSNVLRCKKTSDVTNSILQCVYIRALKLYLKQVLFKYIPIVITELKHVIILFEEDMTRKEFSVDEIRRFTRSFVGQRKGDIYHSPEAFTTYGYLGRLKQKLYKSINCRVCRCDSESERGPATVQFVSQPSSAVVEKGRKVSFSMKEVPKTKPKGQSKTPKSQNSKVTKKQMAPILKQCPLKRKKSGENEEREQFDHVCCEDLSYIEVCDCDKNAKKVTFSQAVTKSESIEHASETETEKTAMSVTFELKPRVIHIPMEALGIFDKKPDDSLEENIVSYPADSEVAFSEQISEVPSEPINVSKEQKRLSFREREEPQDKDVAPQDNIQRAEEYEKVSNVSGSLTESYCDYMKTGIFDDIYPKIQKTKGPSSGRVNYSSSSTCTSNAEEILNDPTDSQYNPFTTLDGHNKSVKRVNDNFKMLSNDANPIYNSNDNNHYDGNAGFAQTNKVRDMGESECMNFQKMKRKNLVDCKKDKLEAMFNKYSAKEKNEVQSITQSVAQPEEESDENSKTIKLAEQFPIEEPEEKAIDNVPVVVELESLSEEKKVKSAMSGKSNFEFLTGEDRRGTRIRYPTSIGWYYPKQVTDQYGKAYLNQIFSPAYKPKYSEQENLGLGYKSILVKTSYSPAENSSIVPKYIKQYKFKSIEDLKNFVQLKPNIHEPYAIAAVKTKSKLGTGKYDKTLKADDLGKYTEGVVPGYNEKYKAYIKTSRLSPYVEGKKTVQSNEWDDDYHTKEGPNEPSIGKTLSYSRLATEAAPEVNEAYTEYFERMWHEIPQNDIKDDKVVRSETPKRKHKVGLIKKAFNSPDDVIEDSRNYKETCRKGEIGFLKKSYSKEKEFSSSQKRQVANLNSDRLPKEQWSDTSDKEIPRPSESHKFVFLQGRLFKPDKVRLCQVCGTCPVSLHGVYGKYATEMDTTNFLECAGCGACVHDLMDASSEDENENDERSEMQGNESSSSGDSKLEIDFLNDVELKDVYFKKNVKHCLSFADLRAVFGDDFDPDKFVYFVKDGNDYICLKDLLRRRYPLKPFPWNPTKLARLRKKKLPLSEIKYYTPPRDIFINKVAAGYELWEKTKIADNEGVKEELKWNKVPKKYEKLFSTTVAPANRPPKKLKPVRNRPPTPTPSTTDLMAHIVEESGGSLHAGRRMVQELRVQEGLIKWKVESAVRAIMEDFTLVAVLKLKEGYPSLERTLSKSKTRFFYQPTGYHTYYAERIVAALADMMISLEIKHINFARLQPLVDILLRYVMYPRRFPLLFPESVMDIIEKPASGLCPSPTVDPEL